MGLGQRADDLHVAEIELRDELGLGLRRLGHADLPVSRPFTPNTVPVFVTTRDSGAPESADPGRGRRSCASQLLWTCVSDGPFKAMLEHAMKP